MVSKLLNENLVHFQNMLRTEKTVNCFPAGYE